MNFARYLWENIRWNCHKKVFEPLVAISTTESLLTEQLQTMGERYFHERTSVETITCEFCLNQLALKRPATTSQKVVMQQFDGFWQDFLRIKKIFEREYLVFPANGKTRIEQIATLIAKCTGFCLDKAQLEEILYKCEYLLDLTEREVEYLPYAVDLAKINHYCALAEGVFSKNATAEKRLAKTLDLQLLKGDFAPNDNYRQAIYQGENIISVCDCMGNSKASFGGTSVELSLKSYLYKNGRNVFDTFCSSKFGKRTAEFWSNTRWVEVWQRYFLQDGLEIRNLVLTNKGKTKGKFNVEIVCHCKNGKSMETTNALAWDCGAFVGVVAMQGDKIIKCKNYQNTLSFEVEIPQNGNTLLSFVTIYASSHQELTQKLSRLCYYGATKCPHLYDTVQEVSLGQKLHLTPSSNGAKQRQVASAKQLNFTYQMGDEDVATFVDNGGNQTTLIKGFVFGTGGERVYAVNYGSLTQLNCGEFVVDGKLTYDKGKSRCVVTHSDKKHIAVQHSFPTQTLFYFPLERASKITFDKNKNLFAVYDGERNYTICCNGKIESYTTDAIECNLSRLRYKLSNTIEGEGCLAFCVGKSLNVTVTVAQAETTPLPTPLVQESLVSTYLNYVNGKQVFCFNNHLKRPTALALAGVCYTNPQFVKGYLQRLWKNKQKLTFYDAQGELQPSRDELLFDLACVYYATLVKDESFPTEQMKRYVASHLLQDFDGQSKVIQALALKRASQLEGFDKVKCLVEYASLKKIISGDVKLYPLAQAVGAVPLVNPSKQRLKDLCNAFDVPKNWYYVSQLENLYGLRVQKDSLAIAPTITEQNVLEQFALNFGGKRIQTTFTKGAVQCMTLNGAQCHQAINPYALKEAENTLVVHY